MLDIWLWIKGTYFSARVALLLWTPCADRDEKQEASDLAFNLGQVDSSRCTFAYRCHVLVILSHKALQCSYRITAKTYRFLFSPTLYVMR